MRTLNLALSTASRETPADGSSSVYYPVVQKSVSTPVQSVFGLLLPEVRSIVPRFDPPEDIATAECTYARSASLPAGAVLMFTNGTLARVDILSGRVKSELGAGIGDAEEEVKLLYGGSVVTSPHKYTQGHYMTVRPANSADSTFRIVFETDGNTVIRYRSGRLPEVEYVEGCG